MGGEVWMWFLKYVCILAKIFRYTFALIQSIKAITCGQIKKLLNISEDIVVQKEILISYDNYIIDMLHL